MPEWNLASGPGRSRTLGAQESLSHHLPAWGSISVSAQLSSTHSTCISGAPFTRQPCARYRCHLALGGLTSSLCPQEAPAYPLCGQEQACPRGGCPENCREHQVERPGRGWACLIHCTGHFSAHGCKVTGWGCSGVEALPPGWKIEAGVTDNSMAMNKKPPNTCACTHTHASACILLPK